MAVKLEDVKKFALSRNFFLQVVKPLFESEDFDERSHTALKKLLQDDIHKSFWRTAGPQTFDNALAGKFQEVLDVYRQAVRKHKHAQLGAFAGVGGDTSVVKKPDGDAPGITKTAQFKTVASATIEGVHENIQKAAWQLCGLGGEKPVDGSRNVIEVILFTATFASYTTAQWEKEIKEALEEGYSQNAKGASGDTFFKTVHFVKITTSSKRYKFQVQDNPHKVTFVSEKDTAKGEFIFDNSSLKTHWEWLRLNWWKDNVTARADKDTLIPKTIKGGIGSAGAYPTLPFHAAAPKAAVAEAGK